RESYQRGVTDEFVEPIVIQKPDREGGLGSSEPVATIQDGDAVIFFNFRPDRARQLARALAIAGFDQFPTSNRPTIDFVCFSVYDVTFPLAVAFPPQKRQNILADVLTCFGIEFCMLVVTAKDA